MVTTLDIAKRVSELVRIPSVNPLQAGPMSGDDGETELAHFLADRTEALGASVVLDEALPGRPNVYAHFEGQHDKTIVIDAHLDTVSVEHMTDDPFDGRIEDDRVYGRGSVDTKATFAVVMAVLEELLADNGPGPNVWLVGTISEEVGGLIGANAFRRWVGETGLGIDQLIIAEPTLCAAVHGHKGALGLEITVNGVAAHSSKPHLGANAISAAGRIIDALDAEHQRLQDLGGTTAVGPGTLSITEIKGGVARNIIPDCCTLYAGRRTAPGEDPAELFVALREIVEAAAAPVDVVVDLAYGRGSAAFYEDPAGALINELSQLADSQPETATYGSNALAYIEMPAEKTLFGPGSIDQAHKAVEWVDIAELGRAADVYRKLLRP